MYKEVTPEFFPLGLYLLGYFFYTFMGAEQVEQAT